jgi:hypothetical protein
MNGTELTERLIKDLDKGIEKQSSLGVIGQAALSVIANRVRIIIETINSFGQLIVFNHNDLPKALEDIKENKTEIANRIDIVIQNASLVSETLKSADGNFRAVKEILIEQVDFLNKTFGVN